MNLFSEKSISTHWYAGICLLFTTLLLLMNLFLPAAALSGEATDQLKGTIDKVIAILNDPELKAPDKHQEKRDILRKLIKERFASDEMSRRALGIHWREITQEERQEFIRLFTDLLERTYMDKIESYSGEKFIYIGENTDGRYAVVNTQIITKKDIEVPVNYRLINKDGKWFVYDVSVEGVSLVRNYRTQFNEILVSSSFQQLLKKLEEKQS